MLITLQKSATEPGMYYFEIDLGYLAVMAYMTKKEAGNLAKQLKQAGF